MNQMSEQSERHDLRKWRELRQMTQAQLASAVGMSQQMLSNIEAGKSAPNVTVAFALADALGVADRDILWPGSSRYGVGSKPSIAQSEVQQRKRKEREAEREAANNPSDIL